MVFERWGYVLWLKDSLSTPTQFSEANLAVAMKKVTFPLCLPLLWSPCRSIPCSNSPWCLFPQPDCPKPHLGHPCEKWLQESCCVCGFYYLCSWRTNTFNISYMLKPALLQQYKKGNWLTSQLALKTRSQAALSALHDSFPLLQSKTSHPVCRWEEFTWVEFWLFLLRTGSALCRFLFNCRGKAFFLRTFDTKKSKLRKNF